MKRQLTIIGGGLSGLALANGLRLADVPVVVNEAGFYPRHRVCGEFMAGLSGETIHALGLESCFSDSLNHRESIWFSEGKPVHQYTLPTPVLGISRMALDKRLADLLRQRGGSVNEGHRAALRPGEGVILSCGRTPRSVGYNGLKAHWSDLEVKADLELHMGKHGYVGLSGVESGHVNVCGLFRSIAPGNFPSPVDRFYATLSGHGLSYLAERLGSANYRAGSFCSVSGLSYERRASSEPSGLGDRHRLIPPFTGNGMTIAFESAHKLLPHAIAYARDMISWSEFLQNRNNVLLKGFNRRYLAANLIHPFLLKPVLQSLLCTFARANLIPFTTLYRLTHT